MKEVLFLVLLALFASLGLGAYHPPRLQQILTDAVKYNSKFDCAGCTMATDLTKALFVANGTQEELMKLITGFCIDFKIENTSVCEGIVQVFKDEFFFVISSELSSSNICGWFFDVCPFPNVTYYNVSFPSPKPPHVAPVPPNPADPKFTILQISDVHFDVEYQQGMNNDCGEPLCCRAVNGYGKTPNTTAGKWGDYLCDLNLALLENLADHWQTMPNKPDFVFWTGDNPPHDVWLSTREENINNSAFLTQILKKAFGDIPVFPCIGNHEGVPVNSFPLPPMNSWLMDPLGDQWSVWLSDEAVASFKYGGYYATPLNSHIQVVSLNMNYCNSGNGWLLLNSSGDPGQMLEWLINVLESAEKNQQKVYIIGHIPPGDHNCLPTWGAQFYQIVDRYEDTILAQFYGHTHDDQFEVFYDLENATRATSIAYIVPSVTSYQHINPSYRIFTADTKTGYIVESSTYHTNITLANLQDNPEWVWEYNATSTYNMSSLFPEDWAALTNRFETDDAIFQTYYKYESSSGKSDYCDSSCKKKQICGVRSADSRLLSSCLYGHGIDIAEVAKESKC